MLLNYCTVIIIVTFVVAIKDSLTKTKTSPDIDWSADHKLFAYLMIFQLILLEEMQSRIS